MPDERAKAISGRVDALSQECITCSSKWLCRPLDYGKRTDEAICDGQVSDPMELPGWRLELSRNRWRLACFVFLFSWLATAAYLIWRA